MRSSHVIAILDVNSTVAYLADIAVASPYTGLVVAQFAGYHGGPDIITAEELDLDSS